MGSPQPFVILGHGSEDVSKGFEARAQLPAGYTLVTLAECGAVTKASQIDNFLGEFLNPDNKDLFSNPGSPLNKARIQEIVGSKIHLYREGNLYPNLSVSTLLDWKKRNESDTLSTGFYAYKSGLYSFPLDQGLFSEPRLKNFPLESRYHWDFSSYKQLLPAEISKELTNKGLFDLITILKNLYNDSIFPTADYVESNLKGIAFDHPPPERRLKGQKVEKMFSLNEFKKTIEFPLSAFLEAGGPGVYFYVICRAPKNTAPVKSYLDDLVPNYVSENEYKELKQIFGPHVRNDIELLPTLYPFANRAAAQETERLKTPGTAPISWHTINMREAPKIFRELYNVTMRTRASSNAQQRDLNAQLAAEAAAGNVPPEAEAAGAAAPNNKKGGRRATKKTRRGKRKTRRS